MKKNKKDILRTKPRSEHYVRLVATHPDGSINNSLYTVRDSEHPVFSINFTGKELSSLAWQWLAHTHELDTVFSLAVLGEVSDVTSKQGRQLLCRKATEVLATLKKKAGRK